MPFGIGTTFWPRKLFQLWFLLNIKNWQPCTQIFKFSVATDYDTSRAPILMPYGIGTTFRPRKYSNNHFSKISKTGNPAHKSLSFSIDRWCPAVNSFKLYICHWFMTCFCTNFACHFALEQHIVLWSDSILRYFSKISKKATLSIPLSFNYATHYGTLSL